MSELFADAYSGEVLSVSFAFHERMKHLFPELDLHSFYRSMEAHLAKPGVRKPRSIERFLIGNAKREKVCTLRNSEAWRLRQEAYKREIGVGR